MRQVVEAALSFAFPWAAYYAAEGMALSGIVAILFCGVVMGLYVRPGLSPAAAQLTHDLYETLAKVAETFVFNYIGMAFVTFPIFNPTVWRLAAATLLACFVGPSRDSSALPFSFLRVPSSPLLTPLFAPSVHTSRPAARVRDRRRRQLPRAAPVEACAARGGPVRRHRHVTRASPFSVSSASLLCAASTFLIWQASPMCRTDRMSRRLARRP